MGSIGRVVLAVALLLAAGSARAQSPYVAGSIGADVARVSHTDSSLGGGTPDGSEVWSGSLRVGTSVGESWGVELEFVRSGRSGQSQTPFISPLAGYTFNSSISAPAPVPVGTVIGPGIATFQVDMRQSHTDFDAVAWARQRVGDSVDLVYLGGVAFSRQRVEITQTFPTAIRALLPVPGGSFRTSVVNYATRPIVGAEARIGLTSHMRLIPGLRMQGLSNGWLLRPYAGLGWFF